MHYRDEVCATRARDRTIGVTYAGVSRAVNGKHVSSLCVGIKYLLHFSGWRHGAMAKAIREAEGKLLLGRYFEVLARDNAGALGRGLDLPCRAVTLQPDTDLSELAKNHAWLQSEVAGCLRAGLVSTRCVYRVESTQ